MFLLSAGHYLRFSTNRILLPSKQRQANSFLLWSGSQSLPLRCIILWGNTYGWNHLAMVSSKARYLWLNFHHVIIILSLFPLDYVCFKVVKQTSWIVFSAKTWDSKPDCLSGEIHIFFSMRYTFESRTFWTLWKNGRTTAPSHFKKLSLAFLMLPVTKPCLFGSKL